MDRTEPMSRVPAEAAAAGERPALLLAAGCLVALGVALAGVGLVGWLVFDGLAPQQPDPAVRVLVGVAPIGWLVEQIGGEHVRVSVLIPAGANPHTYSPSPRQAMALGRADVAVFAGLPVEEHLGERLKTQPSLKAVLVLSRCQPDGEQTPAAEADELVELSAAAPRPGEPAPGLKAATGPSSREGELAHGHSTHDHQHAHGSAHDQLDPHVWLSPRLLCSHARSIAQVLCAVDPTHARHYENRLRELEARIDKVDQRIAAQLAPYRGKTFYVFHPAFGHFAEAYGLHQRAIQWPGGAASPRHLHEVIAQARADRAQIILVQPQFDRRPAGVVAEAVDASLVDVDPLAPDVLANLEELAARLAAGWQQSGERPASAAGQSTNQADTHTKRPVGAGEHETGEYETEEQGHTHEP